MVVFKRFFSIFDQLEKTLFALSAERKEKIVRDTGNSKIKVFEITGVHCIFIIIKAIIISCTIFSYNKYICNT